jgi:hypothetical protein
MEHLNDGLGSMKLMQNGTHGARKHGWNVEQDFTKRYVKGLRVANNC